MEKLDIKELKEPCFIKTDNINCNYFLFDPLKIKDEYIETDCVINLTDTNDFIAVTDPYDLRPVTLHSNFYKVTAEEIKKIKEAVKEHKEKISVKNQRLVNFLEEYKKLCKKYSVGLINEDPYCGSYFFVEEFKDEDIEETVDDYCDYIDEQIEELTVEMNIDYKI